MRVLGSIVQSFVMSDALHWRAALASLPVALKLVRHNHSWYKTLLLQ